MPRHTVDINLDEMGEGEAMATLISYVAYPYVKFADDRIAFQKQLYLQALQRRSVQDPKWAASLRPIRIGSLISVDQITAAEFKRAMKKFEANLLMATHFLEPNLESVAGKNRGPRLQNGEEPTVENTIDVVKNKLGWRGVYNHSFIRDVWSPTKLICHLALAISNKMTVWKERDRPSDLFYDLIFDEEFVDAVLRESEWIRLRIAKKAKLRLREQSTLQFYRFRPVPKRLRFA